MNKNVLKVLATREGGQVKRCHVLPSGDGAYNNASHSYGAVSLLLLLHPNPSLQLIKSVQWHDVAERWLGDLPSTTKANNPELKEIYERIEREYLQALGLIPNLTEEEQIWLKAVDTLELYLWCREEERIGNKNIASWVESCSNYIWTLLHEGKLPRQAAEVWLELERQEVPRLSDNFELVRYDLHGPKEIERGLEDRSRVETV